MTTNVKNRIPADSLRKIRDYCYFLAENSEDRSFEVRHTRSVEENAVSLAVKRGLDSDVASLIAVLHDMGRIKNGIYGKGHAAEGAVIAKTILTKFNVSKKHISVICRAISNHSKKRKIQDEYSELIKDADSMTRFRGLPKYDDNTAEYIRNKYAILGRCRISPVKNADVPDIIKRVTGEVEGDIMNAEGGILKPSEIHGIRIKIRQVRSAVWYLKRSVKKKRMESLERLNDDLRKIFKDYERPRKLHVLRKKARSIGAPKKLRKYLSRERARAFKRLASAVVSRQRAKMKKITDALDAVMPAGLTVKHRSLHDSRRVNEVIRTADIHDVDSMHRFRILSKKLIYLHDMGIINFSQPDFIILLKNIHRNIGILNDRSETIGIFTRLKKKKPGILTNNDIDTFIATAYDYDELITKVAENIFELNIRI